MYLRRPIRRFTRSLSLDSTIPRQGRRLWVEHLFLKSLQIEEWNDYDGVWSQELREVSKEVPALEEMKLPVTIKIGEATEDIKENKDGISEEYWKICVHISSDEQFVGKHKEGDKQYLSIGQVNMAWDSLQQELFHIKQVKFLSEGIRSTKIWNPDGLTETVGAHFWVWVKKPADRTQYQVITKEIASGIRRFIRSRLSEYKSLKKGFEE